jgi:hypothetical protein
VHAFYKLLIGATIFAVSLPAEVDLSGSWAVRLHQDWADRGPGPEIVEYLGMPLNEDARAKALSYSASELASPEHQCTLYPPTYLAFGPFGIKMSTISDPATDKVIAWKLSGPSDVAVMTIWMDGRPAPSENAPHPFEGFTTGVWEGNTLTTRTIHFKAGYLRRNGVPISDDAVLTRHIMRHANLLTVESFIEDPAYLTEPYVVSRTWELDPDAQLASEPYHCSPEVEIARLDGTGVVPHILPGQNKFEGEVTRMYNIPLAAVLGGADTMYPEYRKQLRDKYVPPEKCERYCCGWEGGGPAGPGAPTDSIKCIGVGGSTPENPFGRKF